MFVMTPWVLRLLVANVVVFFLTASAPALYRSFAFVPLLIFQRPWTTVTYMFLHAGIGHLLFNMIGLLFFGPRLEQRLGSKGFLTLYFLGGIGGAVFSFLFEPTSAVVGASGAVYGVLLAFGYYWPRETIYIWAVLPVQAWVLVMFLIGASLWSGLTAQGSNVAHFAHLGGLGFAYAYLKWIEVRRKQRTSAFRPKKDAGFKPGVLRERDQVRRWQNIDRTSLHEINRDEVEALLERIRSEGVGALSDEERQFLDRMTGR